MLDDTIPGNRYLSTDHARSMGIKQEWDRDNQQWWDWYMSLAENDSGPSERPLIELPEQISHTAPDRSALVDQLHEPFALSSEHIEYFRCNGYIKLKEVLSPGVLSLLRREMASMFEQHGNHVGNRFGSLEMMWLQNDTVREFVFSARLAKMGAELLGVEAVRLYHDNGLSKQPGCGRTPWHYDAHHFPIGTNNVCTVWIPLQAIPNGMGPLGFAKGMDVLDLVRNIPFNKFDTSYDRQIIAAFRDLGVTVDHSPFELGEISFHHNLSLHTAGPNRTTVARMVLATTYFEDGARVIDAPHMVNGDWRRFMPGVEPGQVIDTPLNPVLYPRPE